MAMAFDARFFANERPIGETEREIEPSDAIYVRLAAKCQTVVKERDYQERPKQ